MAGSFLHETAVDFDIEQSKRFSSFALEFREKVAFHHKEDLEHVEKLFKTILIKSENKPWWIFINALENYVDWLYTHSVNVAVISIMTAVEMGYSDEELWNLGLGAFLHDAGKLLIPKSIIEKPDFLSEMEMLYIRQHCELGVSALKSCCLPEECIDIIMQHHERLDGSGYPRRLAGDEISLNPRIVMVADVVDAIISGRPYRASRKISEAVMVLKNEKGKYDEEIIAVLEEILGI